MGWGGTTLVRSIAGKREHEAEDLLRLTLELPLLDFFPCPAMPGNRGKTEMPKVWS